MARSRQMQNTIDMVLSENNFDIVQTEFSSMGCYTLPNTIVKILDSHNVEYDNFRRMWLKTSSPLRKLHYFDEYKKFYHEELENYKSQDALFVTSSRDKQILDADLPNLPKYVVPNGVDASYFAPSPQSPEPYSMVFTGAMSYIPNSDAMLYFLDSIFPLIQREIPEAKIYIVGSGPPKELLRRATDKIVITNFVDDVRPYVYRSSIFVVPLRMGGGTRLKILEAMAMKKPIVTTSIGCEGIHVRHNESALIADDPETFAQYAVRLLRDAGLGRQLTTNGFELMNAEYEWNVIGTQINSLYQQICKRSTYEPSVTI